MLHILIVEGNSREIIDSNRSAGLDIASDQYRKSLALHAADADFDLCVPYAPERDQMSRTIKDYDGIALTGSGVSWTSHDKQAAPYMDTLEVVLSSGKPVLGSCWGMQTVVQLMGGHCEPNQLGTEVGLAEDITLNDQGQKHWFFEGMPRRFASPCIHRDHVTQLPDCFELLASNRVSSVQAVACTQSDIDFVGVQFHPELELSYVKAIYDRRNMAQSENKLITSFPQKPDKRVSSATLRTRVIKNWIDHVSQTKTAAQNAAA